MFSQKKLRTPFGQLSAILLLVVLAFILLVPFVGIAEDNGPVVPDPIPPTTSQGFLLPDSLIFIPEGGDSISVNYNH